MKKALLFLLACVLLTSAAAAAVDYPADLPYETYIYSSDNEPIAVPAVYETERVITGTAVAGSAFKDLAQVFYDGGDRLYICDAGNNRVLVTDKTLRLIRTLDTFDNHGTADALREPTGVYADQNRLYIADSLNGRILVFSAKSFALEREFGKPAIAMLEESYTYKPTRLTVDNAGRLYVIAAGINQGLLCLDENGRFASFLGAPQVQPNLFDILWRKIATKAQRAQMESYVPTEYDSIHIDADGFLYVTSQTSETVPVGKINSNGRNVLTPLRGSAAYGDAAYLEQLDVEPSHPYFTDVALSSDGIYYTLDSLKGRIYAYTEDGYFLYAFGAIGSQKGTFLSPGSLTYMDGKLLVGDHAKGTVTVLKETAFGAHIRRATALYNAGEYEQARTAWEQVGREASGYALAAVGLAKIDMQNGRYRQAMSRLLPIREHSLYAKAFADWREAFIRDNFIWMLLGAGALLAAGILLVRVVRQRAFAGRLRQTALYRGYKYGTYVMFHPFDGFWDLKWEKKGNMRSAVLITALFFLLYAIRSQFSGYVVTGTTPDDVNALYNVLMLFLPLLFYVIANWCFTTLMEGQGTMRDIFIATAYALKPYVVCSLPLLLLSYVLSGEEVAFYQVADTLCVVWVLALLFIGLMITHEYSLSKSVLCVLLILVGICLIIFILLLLVNIVQEVYLFGYNSYRELSFRTY